MSATPQERPAESIPTGTVTFVFTDIEGSTGRWERDRASMEAAVRRHDELVRGAIEAHHGYVFKTIGDAFCAAFARPEDAVSATLDAQRALSAEDFSAVDGLYIRAAIHTGTADERGGDYYGSAVNRVARLLAIAHGGQVLLSGAAADLAQGDLPSQSSLRDLGEHQLRDLSRPEYVYQLVAPGLIAEFPALRSLETFPNNLPRQMTSFVGREKEIAEITALIETSPLVTLVGSGGVGKTRTSLQVGANLLDGSGDGVWFIELAPLTSGEYVPTTVAAAMGIVLGEGDPLTLLVVALRSKRALLIFDNCEHLVEAAARTISAVLRGCSQIKILASTRQALGIAGEETYRMPSLGVPAADAGARLKAIDVASAPAIALFVERAVSVDKRFELTDENAPTIADICMRLDGIPLAIELAASRVKMLSPRQLRDRLDERFRVLTGGSRDVLPRQQTLRALIDWSHDLLEERERRLFRRLAIFVNGFTIDGATAVAGGDDLDDVDIFDTLASLVDKSLVLAEPDNDSLRYRLLESTRAYASEKLTNAGERDLVASRHLQYLGKRFAALRAQRDRSGRVNEFVEAFAAELEDVRFALDGALAGPDVVDGSSLLVDLGTLWTKVGLDIEGLARNQSYLAALPETESILVSRIVAAISLFQTGSGQHSLGFETGARAVAQARESGDSRALAEALRARMQASSSLGRVDDAEADILLFDEIPRVSLYDNDSVMLERAYLRAQRGDIDGAAKIYEQMRKRYRSLGDPRGEATAAHNLAEIEHARGQTERAIAIARECQAALRPVADRFSLAIVVALNLAGYLLAVDDVPGASASGREAIERYAEMDPDHGYIAFIIEHLALATALRDDLPRAAVLEGYAVSALERHGSKRQYTETTTYDRLTAILRDQFPHGELARLMAEGAAMTPEAAIALALGDT